MTSAQTLRSFEKNVPAEDQHADRDAPRDAKAEPRLSVDFLLVGGSLAIGIILLAITLALKHLSSALY
jgi:hypothetical protein